MHGGNRMAGNSLLETVVLGRRAAAMLDDADDSAPNPEPTGPLLGTPDPSIPQLMWEGCGPMRDEMRMRGLIDALSRLPASLHHDLCKLIVGSALERRESRGVHQRTDFRVTDPAFARRTVSTDLLGSPGR
jgi:L-aspartate oxidase